MITKYIITSDIFLIPWKDKYIIYAPLKNLAFLVNHKMVDILDRIKKGVATSKLNGSEQKSIKPFIELGIINGEPEKISLQDLEGFFPSYVTLFLTNKCNLRCIYCYACGGEKDDTTLPFEIGRSAIDFIINNALLKNKREVALGFHGGGEPTLAWMELKECVEYAQGIASEKNIKINFSIAINGVISEEKIDWIMDNFSSINLSFDGLEEIQNYQRPMANGEGSFKRVMQTIKKLNEKNFAYGIRATITNKSVLYMDKIIEFFGTKCNSKTIHFEPSFNCGRCLSSRIGVPSPDEFIKGYRKAEKIATRLGILLYYSGVRINSVSTVFCKAAGESFCVTPHGDVTSCYEVCSKDDPRSEVFFYGRYDREKKAFVFNEEKIAYLRKRTVNNIPYCADCFCKYHCAGDCLAKASDSRDLLNITNTTRCKINRTLTLDQIEKVLNKAKSFC